MEMLLPISTLETKVLLKLSLRDSLSSMPEVNPVHLIATVIEIKGIFKQMIN